MPVTSRLSVLAGRKILLGITGSIAAYKAVDLASMLTQAGAVVDTVLSECRPEVYLAADLLFRHRPPGLRR